MNEVGRQRDITDPWLSVAIPSYNVAPYIAQCIRSVAQQADAGVEVIVCDDASTDESRAVIRRVASEFPALRIIEHERNSGVGAARNTLLDAARGEYLWYLDGDDMLLPGAIGSLRAIVERHAPDMVLCDFRRALPIRQRSYLGRKAGPHPGGAELVAGMFQMGRMHPWSKVTRRSLWDGLRSPVGRWFEDVTTSAHLILAAESYYYAPQSWVYYRVRSDGFVGSLNRRGTFSMANADAFVQSLAGYQERLTARLGSFDESVRYALASFCGHEFANIVKRMASAKAMEPSMLSEHLPRLRAAIEQNSPMDFETLVREHARKRAFYRYRHLRSALDLVRRHGG